MPETRPQFDASLRRGDATRVSLLDAAEGWVAEAGFDAPTHRGIAQRAHVHAALVNYHFGSMEVLLDDMVGRRAPRLIDAWHDALTGVGASRGPSPDSVLAAYWEPFRTLHDEPQPWCRYLCVVAHLFHDRSRAVNRDRHFGAIEHDFQHALNEALPGLDEDGVRCGFDYARTLLDEALFRGCVARADGAAAAGFHAEDMPRLFRFLVAGLTALASTGAGGGSNTPFRPAAH